MVARYTCSNFQIYCEARAQRLRHDLFENTCARTKFFANGSGRAAERIQSHLSIIFRLFLRFGRSTGEAKAAQERVSFLRRDVERAECQVKESEMVAKRVQDAAVLLRRKDTDLSGAFHCVPAFCRATWQAGVLACSLARCDTPDAEKVCAMSCNDLASPLRAIGRARLLPYQSFYSLACRGCCEIRTCTMVLDFAGISCTTAPWTFLSRCCARDPSHTSVDDAAAAVRFSARRYLQDVHNPPRFSLLFRGCKLDLGTYGWRQCNTYLRHTAESVSGSLKGTHAIHIELIHCCCLSPYEIPFEYRIGSREPTC